MRNAWMRRRIVRIVDVRRRLVSTFDMRRRVVSTFNMRSKLVRNVCMRRLIIRIPSLLRNKNYNLQQQNNVQNEISYCLLIKIQAVITFPQYSNLMFPI